MQKSTNEATEPKDVNPTFIPSSIDWREKGAITEVKNQGQCGSSAAFAVLDSVTAFGEIPTGKLVEVSMQEFLDCCTNHTDCNGGFPGPEASLECIAKLGGLASTETYPNRGNVSGKCRANPKNIAVKVNGVKTVPAGDEMALAAAVAMEPVVVAVDASQRSFMLYHSGIYSDRDCSSTRQDHAVLVVGYGEENGVAYWICKNSWGKWKTSSNNVLIVL